jgi:exosortase/archaeosortase family protein
MDKNKLIKTFLIRALIVFVVWQTLFVAYLQPEGSLNAWLTSTVVVASVRGLQMIGFEAEARENVIFINEEQSVLVADPCNGLELFALFIGFLICFPGGWKSKLVYSVFGCFLISLINVIREIALALNYNYFRATFDLNHKYTYTLVVYVFIFLIWRHWLLRYSIIAQTRTNED